MRQRILVPLVLALSPFVSQCGPRAKLATDQRSRHGTSLVVAAHTEKKETPVVVVDGKADAALEKARAALSAKGATAPDAAVSATVTLRKDGLFDTVFLYGFDLQYSSAPDPKYDLIRQSEVFGHVPARFRRVGDLLQLVADQSRLFESDINRPELLINEYRVVAEDEGTLTVAFERAGHVINQTVNGKAAPAPLQSWIRSFAHDAEGDYLLQETALLLPGGIVQTYMESVFPRATLVPDGYQGLENDPGKVDAAGRYRFLSAEKIFVDVPGDAHHKRVETSFASRYLVKDGGSIDWYVTPNVPDDFLPQIKSGVEGWNRYFRPQLGRDVMVFKGRLPAGVKLGDPRYNVINWDSVAQAGAAYESQASDPFTGIQSHSLIYMPYAWYNIGADLWRKRLAGPESSREEMAAALAPRGAETLFGKKRVLSCVTSPDAAALPAAAMIAAWDGGTATTPSSTDEFGRRILMSTLFHEVGHALGLDHEFKGSLSFDGESRPGDGNPTTWSVMDYNYYQHEMGLFGAMGDTDGPLLEYDRQIISALYNDGKDVGDHDPVIPACNDDEADDTSAGADPLCVRYDAEKDPTLSLAHALANVTQASGARGIETLTLAEATARLGQAFARQAAVSDKPVDGARAQGEAVGELIGYYLASGAQSLRVNLRNNTYATRVWADGVAVADEAAFRGRFAAALTEALAWDALPGVPAQSLTDAADALAAAVRQNPHAGDAAADRDEAAAMARADFLNAAEGKAAAALEKMRGDAYGILGYAQENPFSVAAVPGVTGGWEDLAVSLLRQGVERGLGGTAPTAAAKAARAAAAKALASHAATQAHGAVIEDARQALKRWEAKGQLDRNQALRDEARALLTILGR